MVQGRGFGFMVQGRGFGFKLYGLVLEGSILGVDFNNPHNYS